MKEISNTSKVFILFGVLSVFINQIKEETYKHGAKLWYNRLNNQARQFWRQIQNDTKQYDKENNVECTWAFDEMEAYLVEILREAYNVNVEDMDDFIDYIKNFKKEVNND